MTVSLSDRLLHLIWTGNQRRALEAIMELDDTLLQLQTLERLAEQWDDGTYLFRFYLASAHTSALANSVVSVLVNELSNVNELADALTRASDLACAIARDLDYAINVDRGLAFSLAIARARAIATAEDSVSSGARALASALDRVLGLTHVHSSLDLTPLFNSALLLIFAVDFYKPIPQCIRTQVENDYRRTLANALDESFHLQHERTSPLADTIVAALWHIAGNNVRHITLQGTDILTPDILTKDVAPYLQALRELQKILVGVGGSEYVEFQVVTSEQNSILAEVADLTEAIKEVIKFQKRHQQESQLRDVKIHEQRLTRALQTALAQHGFASILLQQSNTSLEEQTQYSRIIDETQQVILAAQLKLEEFYHSRQVNHSEAHIEYFRLAHEMISERGFVLDPDQFADKVLQAATLIKQFNESNLQLRLGHHKLPLALPGLTGDNNEA